jgi:hypothetical protein
MVTQFFDRFDLTFATHCVTDPGLKLFSDIRQGQFLVLSTSCVALTQAA